MTATLPTAGIWKRFATLIYEAILLAAVLFLADYLFIALSHNRLPKWLLQLYLLGVMGAYFSWFWMHGQSLAMKTWHIHVVKTNGDKLDLITALKRFAFSWLIGISQLWAFVDKDQQFLHDRLAGTRLVIDVPRD
ncbi:MAG: RDD family protein [Sulfuriferula sp.]|nr:RDD family protein [Sulfuriferula sp.]